MDGSQLKNRNRREILGIGVLPSGRTKDERLSDPQSHIRLMEDTGPADEGHRETVIQTSQRQRSPDAGPSERQKKADLERTPEQIAENLAITEKIIENSLVEGSAPLPVEIALFEQSIQGLLSQDISSIARNDLGLYVNQLITKSQKPEFASLPDALKAAFSHRIDIAAILWRRNLKDKEVKAATKKNPAEALLNHLVKQRVINTSGVPDIEIPSKELFQKKKGILLRLKQRIDALKKARGEEINLHHEENDPVRLRIEEEMEKAKEEQNEVARQNPAEVITTPIETEPGEDKQEEAPHPFRVGGVVHNKSEPRHRKMISALRSRVGDMIGNGFDKVRNVIPQKPVAPGLPTSMLFSPSLDEEKKLFIAQQGRQLAQEDPAEITAEFIPNKVPDEVFNKDIENGNVTMWNKMKTLYEKWLDQNISDEDAVKLEYLLDGVNDFIAQYEKDMAALLSTPIDSLSLSELAHLDSVIGKKIHQDSRLPDIIKLTNMRARVQDRMNELPESEPPATRPEKILDPLSPEVELEIKAIAKAERLEKLKQEQKELEEEIQNMDELIKKMQEQAEALPDDEE